MWVWTNVYTSLCFSFLICQVCIIKYLSGRGAVKIKLVNVCEGKLSKRVITWCQGRCNLVSLLGADPPHCWLLTGPSLSHPVSWASPLVSHALFQGHHFQGPTIHAPSPRTPLTPACADVIHASVTAWQMWKLFGVVFSLPKFSRTFLHLPFPFWHIRTIFIFHVTDSRLDSPSSHTRGVRPAVTNAPSFQGEIHTPRPQPLHCSVFAPPLLGPHTCSSRSLECSPPFSDNSVH